RGRVVDPAQHIEAPHPGFLLCQDTYFVGTIKGVGKIYLQSVIDANCSLGFGKLYLSKVPMTAVDVLHDRVVPFYEEHGVAIEHLLTDNGRETCGKPLSHPYELYLTIQQIEHRRTQIGSPETNGFCERFHRTVKEEFFSVAFRRTLYESVDQLQRDLDPYLEFYNRERAHQGYRTRGRTPYQTFLDGVTAMRSETEANPEAASVRISRHRSAVLSGDRQLRTARLLRVLRRESFPRAAVPVVELVRRLVVDENTFHLVLGRDAVPSARRAARSASQVWEADATGWGIGRGLYREEVGDCRPNTAVEVIESF